MEIKNVLTQIVRDGFILVFNQDKLDVAETAKALVKAGIYNMEVTCRIQKPLEKISILKREMPEFVTGAASLVDFDGLLKSYNGLSICDPLPSVDEVVESGADYLVSAINFSDASYEKHAGKIAMIPGCGTATEIASQYSKGANICKLFPAKQIGGPDYIKAIDPAIHKIISIIPTGGTTAENIPDYIGAGVLVLGGSFSMIDKAKFARIVDGQDYDLLADELKKVKELIDNTRAKKWPELDFKIASIDKISKVTGRNFNI